MKQTTDPKECLEQESLREAFRYTFKGGRVFLMEFKQKPVEVLDISAGGMAFKNNGFKQYDVDQVNLLLDIPNYIGNTKFSAQLRILNITDESICQCIFENCPVEKYELIHKYVLEMQKTEIKTKK
ncbi:MAG: PilZ domain-containing protein [Desulfobacteraceae bacterium]|nr:PilZ domain-containing protein [Desulfobacteraceae bacterium]